MIEFLPIELREYILDFIGEYSIVFIFICKKWNDIYKIHIVPRYNKSYRIDFAKKLKNNFAFQYLFQEIDFGKKRELKGYLHINEKLFNNKRIIQISNEYYFSKYYNLFYFYIYSKKSRVSDIVIRSIFEEKKINILKSLIQIYQTLNKDFSDIISFSILDNLDLSTIEYFSNYIDLFTLFGEDKLDYYFSIQFVRRPRKVMDIVSKKMIFYSKENNNYFYFFSKFCNFQK